MSAKYRGLPDIDTAPDVFETADEPEIPLRPNNEQAGENDTPKKPQLEGIDATALPDRRRAERAFGRVRRQDGSYQLGLPPLSRTLSSSSDDRPGRPKESAAARIRRLKAELAEVEKEVSSDVGSGSGSGSGLGKAGPPTHVSEELHNTAAGSGDTQQDASRVNKSSTNGLPKRRSVLPPRQSMDVMGEVVKLQEWLARVDTLGMDNGIGAGADTVGAGGGADVWRYRLGNLGGASAGMGAQDEGEGAYATKAGEAEDGTEGTGSSLAEIDRRMAGLEKLVGDSADGSEKHEHLLTILTQPRHLDAISRRIKLLLVDLDRAAAASRRAGVSVTSGHTATSSLPNGGGVAPESITFTGAEYAQMTDLFNLLPRLDTLLPIIPPLLARLSSLASLHAEAAGMAERLRVAEAAEGQVKETNVDMEELVQSIQQGLKEGGETVKGNWEAVQVRMRRLEERLDKLQ